MSSHRHESHSTRQRTHLATDPSGTGDIREEFITDLRGRFRRVRGLLRAAVGYEHDVFELAGGRRARAAAGGGDDRTRDRSDVPESVFRFDTDAAKVAAFMAWLKRQFRQNVLEPESLTQVRNGAHYTANFVRAAYDRGWRQGRGRLNQAGIGAPEGTLDPFNLPKPRRQLQRLYTRTYRNLETVSEAAVQPVREELTRGLATGENPRTIARKLTKEVRTIQRTDAETLARTEIINSHADATLDRYERADTPGATVSGEFLTAQDEDVCPICAAIEGSVYTPTEMRSETFEFAPGDDAPDHLAGTYAVKPPVHPNCRCTILPVVNTT